MTITQPNEKKGRIEGDLATEHALASSDSMLHKNYGHAQRGAQQHFSPIEASQLALAVLGPHCTVLDPQAGDGSLLQAFQSFRRFGVELDGDQIENATEAQRSYEAIHADIQHVFPLLQRALLPAPKAIVSNPPFGLMWSDPTYKDGAQVGSALLTLYYINRLLADHGQFVFLCGRDRFYRELAPKPEARGIYCAIDCPDLFDDVELPSTIAFGIKPTSDERVTPTIERREVMRDSLDLAVRWVEEQRPDDEFGLTQPRDACFTSWKDAFPAIQREYSRRTDERVKTREFDLGLVGKERLDCQPSAYATLLLNEGGDLHFVKTLHNQSIHYFTQNEAAWNRLVVLEREGTIRIDPRVTAHVTEELHDAHRIVCPLYPLKPQQRLGFLTEHNQIVCKLADPGRGFEAGESYELFLDSATIQTQEERPEQNRKTLEMEVRTYHRYRKALRIRIDDQYFVDDEQQGQADIRYLTDHFEIPDPGDVGTRYPEETLQMLAAIEKIETEKIIPNTTAAGEPRRYRPFQKQDLARLLVKRSGILAWEQGLGKTIGGGTFAEACVAELGAKDQVLIITPQDLIPQWRRELRLYLGREVTLIKSHAQAKEIAKHLRMGGTGWYITYYEALSVAKTRGTKLLPADIVVQTQRSTETVPGGRSYDPDTHEPGEWIPEHDVTITKELVAAEFCPNCLSDSGSGWNGRTCRGTIKPGILNGQHESRERACDYVHYEQRVKPMAALLTTAFRKGVILIDEMTMVKGDEAMRSKTIRGLRAKHKLGLTGTPVKNFIPDAFWLLWYALGNASSRFPYDYQGGKTRFENDFAVVEYRMKDSKKANRKVLPEVTNLSMLWKLLCSSIIRRRTEETGESMVPMRVHEVEAPLGVTQARFANHWLKHFPDFFAHKFPTHNLVRAGLVDVWAPMIGLQPKLDYAATLPEADPDWPWTQIEVSNWTPANLKVLEITMALVRQGRKVLVGSNLKLYARWVTEQLETKGVKAIHLLDSSDNTADPRARATRVHAFQADNTQVLCAGIKALRLGHDLQAASAVVINGLEWAYDDFAQFTRRVRRLTSKKSIDLYVVLPVGTLTDRKWNVLGQKSDAADLALDGRLTEYQEETVSEKDIIQEMIDRGIPVTGDEVDEHHVQKVWRDIPSINRYTAAPELLGDTGEHEPQEVVVHFPGGRQVTLDLPPIPEDFFDDTGQASMFDDELASFDSQETADAA